MEQALAIMLFSLLLVRFTRPLYSSPLQIDDATVTLPPHLNYLAVLDQDGHGALSTSNLAHASPRYRIGFHVILDKLTALPLQPLAHFAGVGTARSPIEFKPGHGSTPPTIRV